jgi:hypothetical protein
MKFKFSIIDHILKEAELRRKAQSHHDLPNRLDDNVVTGLGQVLPYFLTANSALNQFWSDNHAFWSKEVKAFKSGKKLYLVDQKGTTIELSMTSREVPARPHPH